MKGPVHHLRVGFSSSHIRPSTRNLVSMQAAEELEGRPKELKLGLLPTGVTYVQS